MNRKKQSIEPPRTCPTCNGTGLRVTPKGRVSCKCGDGINPAYKRWNTAGTTPRSRKARAVVEPPKECENCDGKGYEVYENDQGGYDHEPCEECSETGINPAWEKWHNEHVDAV